MFLHNIMYRENGENARQDAIARKNSKNRFVKMMTMMDI